MVAKEYLGRSRLFRRLKNGAHGEAVERYAVCLVNEGLARHGTWRCLNLVGDLLSWIAGSPSAIPSFFEIKEAGGVCALSEKNRIVGF
jgi:hypothetical protein